MLECQKCHVHKHDDEFHREADNPGRNYKSSYCKDCTRERNAAYKASMDPERAKAYARDHYHRTKSSRKRQIKNNRLKGRYGITLAELEAMEISQKLLCGVCERRRELVVDHCHDTGEVRGLLCRSCNLALGFLERPTFLERSLEYLS